MLLVVPGAPGQAQQSLRPAAVVNDEAISVLDLQMRIRMVMLASGMQASPERFQQVARQVLRTLIDEKLQLQEAKRLGLEVTETEVRSAARSVAQNNDMALDQFLQVLERNNVMPQSFLAQVRAQIAWQKVIAQQVRPEIDISDGEVQEVVDRLKSQSGEQQLRVREIFLASDDSQGATNVQQTARRLVQELRNGADFAALARQFSQSATAAVGGDMGWVTPASLPEALASRVQQMSPGTVAGPVRTYDGVHILQLLDTRRVAAGEEKVQLKQLFLPLRNGTSEAAVAELETRARELTGEIEGCEAMAEVSETAGSAASGDLGTIKLADLPGNVRQAISGLAVGAPSEPIQVNQGVAVLMVCERQTSGVDREEIRQNLMQKRATMLAQRYLRDLRRQAHIDIRLQ